ncbi:MAG: guanylate kinase [Chloroflexi bacterium]|nr:guanylate kinase [Chloroflexota bacterium]
MRAPCGRLRVVWIRQRGSPHPRRDMRGAANLALTDDGLPPGSTRVRAERGGSLFVLSGPAGAGKTALVQHLRLRKPEVYFCVTGTTRKPRPGEKDGVDYYFSTEPDFLKLRDEGGLVEWARVPPNGGFLYGTPRSEIERARDRGSDVLLSVDVQGARSIRAQFPNAVLIFLRPADAETLHRRLVGRGTESPDELALRLQNAQTELDHEAEFDYSVVNADGKLSEAVDRVEQIIESSRDRAP